MVTQEQIKSTAPDEVLEWEVRKVEAALKVLDITIGKNWSKAKKAMELCKAITEMNANPKVDSAITSQYSNLMMMQVFSKFMEKTEAQPQLLASQLEKSETQTQLLATQLREDSKAQSEAVAAQMEAIAEKISATPEANNAGGGNKSRAKGLHPEKIERDIDYASFLQWIKAWNLYVVSDNLDSLSDKQKTAIFFSSFTKELLSDMEYRFKIDINADQKVEEVIESMKIYLKGQRSIILARYNLFTRSLHHGETFEDWYCELRRLYDLAEAEGMTGDDLLIVLITTGIREEKVR